MIEIPTKLTDLGAAVVIAFICLLIIQQIVKIVNLLKTRNGNGQTVAAVEMKQMQLAIAKDQETIKLLLEKMAVVQAEQGLALKELINSTKLLVRCAARTELATRRGLTYDEARAVLDNAEDFGGGDD